MNNKYYNIVAISLLMILVTSCQSSQSSSPLIGRRQVTESSLGLVEQWRVSTSREDYSAYYPPPLAIIGDCVVIGFDSEQDKAISRLEGISLESGKVLWKSLFKGNISASFHDSQRIFLMSAYHIGAYRLSDGKRLWENDLKEHQSYWFLPWDPVSPLKIYSSEHELFQVDPETGKVLSIENTIVYMQYDKYQFVYTVEGLYRSINAVDPTINRVIWSHQIDSKTRWQPGIVDNNLVFFEKSVASKIVSIDIPSGKENWETSEEFVSNYAIVNEQLFALTREGALVALNPATGQRIGQMSFSNPSPQDPGGYPFWVAGNENYVLIYFGDSQELIAFKSD